MYTYKIASGRLLLDGGEIVQTETDPAYQVYLSWLQAQSDLEAAGQPFESVQIEDDSADFAAEMAALETIKEAAAFGVEIINSFMNAAMLGGVNSNPATAAALNTLMLPAASALEKGALHAALGEFAKILATPELLRAAMPYSADAAIVPIYNMIANVIGVPSY